jgi:hypothetical protein
MKSTTIKYKIEIEEVCKSIEHRIEEICKKFSTQNVNAASIPAFWMAIQGDILIGLEKAEIKKRRNKKKIRR